ncbi:uncharacterized protein LOC143286523 [Babylonia areolata]|uniref:uncharacterized protein LOC143286523 n=1 Tax=Babylonia areolata TaxID=304850 RepID=UPI003FD551E0
MANSAGPLVVSLSKDSRASAGTGMNGKKQKSRLENILFKLKKADPEDASPCTPASPASPDASSQGSMGEVAPIRDCGADSAGQRGSSDSISSSINRRSFRKPTRRERGSQSLEHHVTDTVTDGNDVQHAEDRGDPKDEALSQEGEVEMKPDIAALQIKVEREDEEDWPGMYNKMSFSSDPFSEQQDDDVPNTDTFSCDQCGVVFPSLHELDTHIDTTHIKQEAKDFSVYPCNVCGKSFASEGYLSRHMTTHDAEEADDDQEQETPEDNALQSDGTLRPTHKCDQCRRLFYTDDDFQQHKCRKGLLRPFGCGRCGRSYSHLPILKNHLSQHEKGLISDLECYQCGQKFMYSIELRRHMSIHIKADLTALAQHSSAAATSTSSSTNANGGTQADSGSQNSLKLKIPYSRFLPKKKLKLKSGGNLKTFTCQICKKTFLRRSYLTMHMRVHGEKKFKCSYCSKEFAFKKSLEIHVRIHTGEKPYQCSFCTKSFTRQDSLYKHEKIHLGVKPFVCETCGRQYGDKFELYRHSLSHSQEKPFKCKLCSKAYTEKKRLKEHMFCHSGDLPYNCDQCGKGFARKYRYTQHLSQHAGDYKFRCERCNRGFYRRSDLNSHMETHSNKKPYTCEVCGTGFLRESYLRRHMIVHSSEKPHQCNICGKGFARKTTLQRHILIHERKDEKAENPEFTGVVNKHFSNYTADFGLGISGSVAPMTGSNAEERDIMKDIQAVIGLGDDVNVFE